jgi:hypothetical protein
VPNGIADWRIQLEGLTSNPTRVRITNSVSGGVWESPYNFQNWVIATQYAPDGTGSLWFEPFGAIASFHVQVWYLDGTTAEADTVSGAAILGAQFLGISTEDRVGAGAQLTANGIPDWLIRLQGLKAVPTRVRITSSVMGGVWESPYNFINWFISTQYSGGTGDLWFERLPGAAGFHVQVWYADGTTAETDATP